MSNVHDKFVPQLRTNECIFSSLGVAWNYINVNLVLRDSFSVLSCRVANIGITKRHSPFRFGKKSCLYTWRKNFPRRYRLPYPSPIYSKDRLKIIIVQLKNYISTLITCQSIEIFFRNGFRRFQIQFQVIPMPVRFVMLPLLNVIGEIDFAKRTRQYFRLFRFHDVRRRKWKR